MKFSVKVNFSFKDLKVNRLLRFFIVADLFFWSGWGMLNPIFALFVIDRIPGASVVTVGIASAIYWVTKAIFQMPVALYLDKHEGERDDFHALISGLILGGIAAFSFILIKSTAGLYFVIFLQALAFGLYTPAFSAIFSRHLDKKNYAFDWSLDSTSVSLILGATAFLGAALAGAFGYDIIFVITSVLSFVSALILIFVPDLILPNVKIKTPIIRDHGPANIGK